MYYIIKKGDRASKQYSEPYQVASLEQVGKLSLAAVLQMPGSARSNSQQMYKDEYYQLIFGADAKEGIIADLLKISYYYDCFLKTEIQNRGYEEKTVLPMLKNGKTFQLAAIGFLCKVYNKVFTYDIIEILTGADNMMPGMEPNRGAATKIEEYLEMQAMKNLPTSMADIQSRYSAIPYGWKEIDIAAVAILRNVGQKTPYSG